MIKKTINKFKKKLATQPENRISNTNGFSLLEVLIAIAIFSIGILGIASMQSSALSGNNDARKVSGSTEKAVALLEELTRLPYNHANLQPATHTPDADSDGIDNNDDGVIDEVDETGNFSVVWTVLDDAPVLNTRTVAVTVASAVPPKQVTLASVVPLK